MTYYVALLRGINVGGHNKVAMSDLRTAFEGRGLQNVTTYINSGNIFFDSGLNEKEATSACEMLLSEDLGLNIPVCLLPATELAEIIAHAPPWWNIAAGARHDAFFVLTPWTAEGIGARIGPIREGYEQVHFYGRVIFQSALWATFSRTSWSKITKDKEAYNAITVRGANTALKLAELASRGGIT